MKLLLLLPLLLPLLFFPQVPTLFPDPWPGANKTAVATDSAGGKSYFTTAQNFNPHNRWKLFRYTHATQVFDSLSGSGFGPARITFKMKYRNGKLFLLDDKTAIRCLDLQTNSWLWTSGVDNPSWEQIQDLEFSGDTLFLAGDFSGINGVPRWSIAALNVNTGSVLTSWDPSQGGLYDFTGIQCMKVSSGMLYAGGNFLINGKQNLLGITIANELLHSWNPQPNDSIYDMELAGDQLYVAGKFTNIHGTARNRLARINLATHTLNGFSMGANGTIDDLEWYPGLLLLNGTFTQIGSQGRNGLGAISLLNNQPNAWNPGAFPRNIAPIRLLDKVFLTRTDLPNWNVYCLPPTLSQGFLQFDTLVCRGDSNILYSVDPGWYAATYTWSYSGSGTSVIPSGDQCLLHFSSNAGPGMLSVIMTSSCGAGSGPISIPITIAQPPISSAGPDDTLTCEQTFVLLTGNAPSNTFSAWNGPISCSPCINLPVTQPGNYYYTVQDSVTGCANTDTLIIRIDTLSPQPILPSGIFEIGCGGTPVLLDGNTSCTRCRLTWHDAANQNAQPDPASYSAPENYFLVALDTVNGCKDSTILNVGLNVSLPNSGLQNLPINFPAASAYFTCLTDSILLDGASDTLNTVLSWRNLSTLQLFPDPFYPTNPGIYKLVVTRTNNQCSDSSLFVLLGTDTAPPLIIPAPVNFTCSDDSVFLNAQIISPNTTLTWTDSLGNNFPNPAWIYNTGKYYSEAIRLDNGCLRRDSIFVDILPILRFASTTDSLVCPNSLLVLSPDPIGATGSLQYSWSDSSSGTSLTVLVSSDTAIWVDLVDSAGCTGRDSFVFQVAEPLQDSISAFLSCDGSDSGDVFIQIEGGIPPYQYSHNGGQNFQGSNYFPDLPFGTYAFVFRDSLGCVLRDTLILNSTVSPPTVHFLMTEILYAGDTVQAVDLSLPLPDSVHWSLTGPVTPLLSDSSLFILEDSGSLSVTLTVFHPGCQLYQTRNFYISLPDSSTANAWNENGILDIQLFPNPNAGSFSMEISLAKKQDLAVWILDPAGQRIFSQNNRDITYFFRSVNLSDPTPGVYRLMAIAEYDVRSVAFIIEL